MQNPVWRKSRWNGLPSLWEEGSSWCLQLGPDQAGGTECRLSTSPPNERPEHSWVFQIDSAAARWVLVQLAETAEHCLSAQRGLMRLSEVGVVRDVFIQW